MLSGAFQYWCHNICAALLPLRFVLSVRTVSHLWVLYAISMASVQFEPFWSTSMAFYTTFYMLFHWLLLLTGSPNI